MIAPAVAPAHGDASELDIGLATARVMARLIESAMPSSQHHPSAREETTQPGLVMTLLGTADILCVCVRTAAPFRAALFGRRLGCSRPDALRLGRIPYLNGGLFQPSPFEERHAALRDLADALRGHAELWPQTARALAFFAHATILKHDRLEEALSFHLARKIGGEPGQETLGYAGERQRLLGFE